MKRITYLAFFAAMISTFAISAFADIKIKSKQTVGGQTMESTTYIKGKRERSESMNGMMINLTQCDMRRNVQMNSMTKTYIITAFADPSLESAPSQTGRGSTQPVSKGGVITSTITIKDTGERKQMFGYTARHLIITTVMDSSADACNKTKMKMETDGWYIDLNVEFNCYDAVSNYNSRNYQKPGGCQDRFSVKTIGTAKRGYPVYEKMTMFDDSGKETLSTVNEVVELSKATLEPSLFEIASDYREVQNASDMYSASAMSGAAMSGRNSNSNVSTMSLPTPAASTAATQPEIGVKKPGTVRLGIADIKIAAVAEGMNGSDLADAFKGSLAEYLKMPNVEVVFLEAKLPSAIQAEAAEKDCDYILYGTVNHKKGGGGFGVFSKVIAPAVGAVGIGHTGSTAGNIAGGIATRSIVTAGQVAGNVKAKDEISLEMKITQANGAVKLAKVFKKKAKNDGEDIITPIVEEAAQAIVDATK